MKKKTYGECSWYFTIGYPNLKTVVFYVSKEKNLILSKIQSLTSPESEQDVKFINGNPGMPRFEVLWIMAGANRGPTIKNLRESFGKIILPSIIRFYIRKLPQDKNRQLKIF